ncbi:MAG TPA: 4-(cytidine 5'-diphospho)-2-C-methyl-D-erythritol kinase [Phycisphaerae bacterium]|nr:4-(cytidine 5'-diphospho)-2-C-methyl-D-erythritol kinase [Phycisphaerae bacterium]
MDLMVTAPAKINWTLRVLRRRDDGYHDIESLVSTVSLHDDLAFSPRHDARFVLTCDNPSVPTDESNLICRAATLLQSHAPPAATGWNCRLSKRIPVGGGLGGGSSNGAAALIALNQLWSLGWSKERLMAAAAVLGSDVPFFILGGTAVIAGRGEQVRPTALPWHGCIVLMMPAFPISTAAVYRAWRPSEPPNPVERPAADPSVAVNWIKQAYNMLEEPAMRVCPALAELIGQAAKLIDRPVRISGSGSTLFTAYDSEPQAREAADLLNRQLGIGTCVVQPVGSM